MRSQVGVRTIRPSDRLAPLGETRLTAVAFVHIRREETR
jgi:hypothetical protein